MFSSLRVRTISIFWMQLLVPGFRAVFISFSDPESETMTRRLNVGDLSRASRNDTVSQLEGALVRGRNVTEDEIPGVVKLALQW